MDDMEGFKTLEEGSHCRCGGNSKRARVRSGPEHGTGLLYLTMKLKELLRRDEVGKWFLEREICSW